MKIQKNDRIRSLISHLEKNFGSNNMIIKDFWDSDPEAIGFSNTSETKLVYVSAYEDDNDFFVALESGEINTSEYQPVFERNEVTLEELESIFREHLLTT